ncbi:MAG: hypothetical protein GY751_11710 [Bacteroidetes bacterium]|nr:hypothetical protein [Bacteroidota bacterium]
MTVVYRGQADNSTFKSNPPVRLYCKQEGRGGMPIFMVHGDKANSLLPKYLPDSIPFWAFYHMRFDGKTLKYKSVHEIAAMYVKELKKVQPAGPYFLSGFSLGGMYAFEMAHQLTNEGENVSALVMIDSKSHTVDGPKKFHNQQFKWTESRVTRIPRKIYKKVVVKLASKLNLPIPKSQRPFYILEQYRKGRRLYKPEVYQGDITLIRSTIDNFEDRHLGWKPYVGGKITIVDIETNHHDLTLEPKIEEVAEVFKEAYRRTGG